MRLVPGRALSTEQSILGAEMGESGLGRGQCCEVQRLLSCPEGGGRKSSQGDSCCCTLLVVTAQWPLRWMRSGGMITSLPVVQVSF